MLLIIISVIIPVYGASYTFTLTVNPATKTANLGNTVTTPASQTTPSKSTSKSTGTTSTSTTSKATALPKAGIIASGIGIAVLAAIIVAIIELVKYKKIEK